MKAAFPKISKPFAEAETKNQIIVIGSGYGGSVAASRLARAGQSVTVLERGREIRPGEYPNDLPSANDEIQVTLSKTGKTIGKTDGLYDFRIGDDMNVFVGCGLGGTSLINANVAIEPDRRIFSQWPDPYKSDPKILDPYFDRARAMLGSNPLPSDQNPPKLRAFSHVAKGLGVSLERPDLNVTFTDGLNAAGIHQFACNHCGDCVSGCNYGAKNTVLMNYLPDAVAHGASLFTGAEVTHLIQGDGIWQVHTTSRKTPLTADIVILAAGSLGSTEILLRSDTLALSNRLGQRFSGNGDVWAFGYNANIKDADQINAVENRSNVYGVGAGPHHPDEGEAYAPGPCITGMIRLQGDTLSEDMLIEEGVMPGALAAGYAAAFPVIDALMGDPFRFGDAAQRLQDMADVANAKSLADSAYDGPVARTLPFLVMSHDSSAGVLEMKADRISVRWKNAGLDPAIVADGAAISRASDAIKAEYLPMPFWQDAFGNRLITVHPIGGCAMGKDHKSGVVNSDCQVFRHDGGLYEGLFVCDGASLPGGVGVNPHLTITAVAERAMDELVKAQGWQTDTTPAKPLNQSVPSKPAKLGLSDLEKLHQALSELVHAITEGDLPLSKSKISNVWLMLSIAYAKLVPVDLKKRYPIASQETLFEVLKSDTDYTAIVLPIAEQMLDLLIASKPTGLRERLKNLETLTGDFSPGGGFDEIMRGRISSLGLTDNPASRDPFRVAAKAGANCTFTAKIRTEKIRRATTPPDGFLSIESGTFHSEAIGGSFFIKDGKFRFMMPDPEVVEKWEMTYAGNLMSAGSKDEQLRFECFKTIQRREGSHWWRDLTECRVKVFKDNVEIARGLLELELQDLIEQAVNLDISYTTKALMQGFIDAYEVIKGAGLDAPSTLPDVFDNPALRANLVLGVAHVLNENGQQAEKALTDFYKAQVLGKFGEFALRTYGGVFSYASNFQERDRNESLVKDPYLNAATYQFESEPGVWLQLTHYPGTKGPIVLAGGFGTCASSFALPTVDQNLVQALMAEGYDIWLFDYRGSGAITASQIPFTLDQVAQYDWPTAIDEVLKRTPVKNASDVQVLVHCIGSMSLFMALLYQRLPVRQVIASATGPFAITNWYNYAKSDVELSRYVAEGLPRQMWGLIDMLDLAPDVAEAAKHGLAVFDPRAPSPHPFYSKDIDNALTGLAWKVPGFAPTECYSPTCHRITFGFGPSYLHAQLNQATHNTIADLFGPVASRSFIHIAKIFERGTVIDVNGADIYMPNVANLDMPIHFIVGALNQEMLPEATLRAQHWLQQNNGNPERYTRHVYPNYGHMDCFIGKDADKHIFPKLLDMLSSRA